MVTLSPASRAQPRWWESWSWGWRPRLYAVARFAGSTALVGIVFLRLAPQALCCRPLRGL